MRFSQIHHSERIKKAFNNFSNRIIINVQPEHIMYTTCLRLSLISSNRFNNGVKLTTLGARSSLKRFQHSHASIFVFVFSIFNFENVPSMLSVDVVIIVWKRFSGYDLFRVSIATVRYVEHSRRHLPIWSTLEFEYVKWVFCLVIIIIIIIMLNLCRDGQFTFHVPLYVCIFFLYREAPTLASSDGNI